jgi:hypothetical protein
VKRSDYLFPPRTARNWNRDNQPHEEVWAPRNLKPVELFSVRWQYPVMVRDQALNPNKLKTAVTKSPKFTEDQLIAPIAVRALTASAWKEGVLHETGMSKATFNRLLMTVKETPGVNFNPDTKQYSYANPDGGKLA